MNDETIVLQARDGARALVHPQGGQVLSWIPAGEQEDRLYRSPISQAAPGVAIRGGVPVIFPQFASEGPLPRHGFARTARWSLLQAQSDRHDATAVLQLCDSDDTRAIWPSAFELRLRVSVTGRRLELELAVGNTGSAPFVFTAALHSYLRVGDIAEARLDGLAGLRYRDSAARGLLREQRTSQLQIKGEVDRIYLDAPPQLLLSEGGRELEIAQEGFTDTVVWNPGPAKAAALADLPQPDGYRQLLCVEAARIGRPIRLPPGQRWRGIQTLRTA